MVVPEKNVLKKESFTNMKIDEKYYFETNFWGNEYKSDYFETLDKILPKRRSWSNDIIYFGQEDSNVLKVIIENNKVVEVILRIDFRTDYLFLLNEILEFCRLRGFILLDENLNIMPFNSSIIIRTIENSPQYNKLKELSGL